MSCALLLTIALGVGSNAAIYGFLEGLTHPASPVGGSGTIVSIFRQDRYSDAGPLSIDDYQLLKNSYAGSDHRAFDWIGAVRINPREAVIADHAEIATVAALTPELARALAIPLDGGGVAISHRISESDFGSNKNPTDSHLSIDKKDFKIDGIAPDRLDGIYNDQSVDLWIQSKGQDLDSGDRSRQDIWVLARLRNDISIRQAQTILRPGSGSLREVSVIPFTGIAPGMARGLSRIGVFLLFSAGAVFFIACINAASFLLGRALRRSHETSLRIALGATRSDLLWELFADSVVISVTGGALGAFLGILTAHTLPAFLFEEDAARLTFAPHLFPILAATLVCIVITIICGMMPVLGTVTDRPWTVLQRETGSPSKTIQRLRSALVIGQIATCSMLIICTALLVSGLLSALETSAGHRLGNPILLTVQAPVKPEVDVAYFADVERKTKSIAGLQPLAWMARLPGNRPLWRTFRIQRLSSQFRDVSMDIAWLTPGSLQQLDDMPIAGRTFGTNDQRYRVAVVDEEAARELFGLRTVGLVIRDSANLPIEIIGIVKRRSDDPRQQKRPIIYYGYVNQPEPPSPIRNAQFRIPLEPSIDGVQLSANIVSSSYFTALDMPSIVGHTFLQRKLPAQGRVAVINQEAADLYFGGNPLGVGIIDDRGIRTEVIGVVRSQILGTFEQHVEPTIYFPMWQDAPARMTLMLRDSKWNRAIAADLRSGIENVPGSSSGSISINTLDNQLAMSGLAALRIAILIGSASTAIALILSILGLISSQTDAERQRRHDRALRMALGSQRWRIVLLVMKSAARLALVGTVLGTLLAAALLRILIAGITVVASPPLQVWLIAPLLPVAAVMIASLLPARRAAAMSPLSITRDS